MRGRQLLGSQRPRNSYEAKPYCLLKPRIKIFLFPTYDLIKSWQRVSCNKDIFQILYTQIYTFLNMATSNPTHFHKTILCTYIYSIIHIQSISLQNIINYSTCTNVRRILICSSVQSACTWKIVFKTGK